MRILVLTSTFPRWAGDAQPPFVLELCKRLSAAHDVLVIAPHCAGAAGEETLGERLAVRRFRYAPQALELLAYGGGILENLRRARWRYLLVPLFLLAECAAARRAIRQLRPDVIHAHWIIPQGAAGALARLTAGAGGVALVCTSHGADLFALRGPLGSFAKRWVLRRVAALTVVSSAMKAHAEHLGAASQAVRVMPMGVDARQRFCPDEAAQRSAHELLFVGRLVRKKGVTHLLEAFAIARRKAPEARLTVLGTGPLEEALKSRARELDIAGAVTFGGAVPNADLAPHYRRAAALVMPSVVADDGDQEGLGLVMAEALACECPVIASDLPAIRDLVEDGVTGLLARQGDASDLADKIVALLRDPVGSRGLARHGREVVLERFDWQTVAQGYEHLLGAVSRARHA